MKKDRSCMSPYPVYPPYQGMPFQGIAQNQMMGYQMPMPYNSTENTTLQDQINNLSEQINLLDKRITNLETIINKSSSINSYSSSNYQMM